MNIQRAKQEIHNSISAYLSKEEYGAYRIPLIRQRPILLMGPPGIGKTQIMEQVARECRINLVAYTITHHTRQSAVGLPFISKKTYQGESYSVTEYTMSEIISAVYEKIEKTGISEGILFIDEINCVSETLAPTMLQFLQCKTFGNQQVPEGWIIVAAGNPPEYNKSVRDFDVVTLDRIKKIEVEENFEVWREYAWKEHIHPAVITYLNLRKEHFYRIETTVDGRQFATARGWEDLSALLQVYETMEQSVDREVISQYLQHAKIAKDFANYLELYRKYQKDYGLADILDGKYDPETLDKLKFAAFDEKLSIIGLLSSRLGELFLECWRTDSCLTNLFTQLSRMKQGEPLQQVLQDAERQYEQQKAAEQLTKEEARTWQQTIRTLERYRIQTAAVTDAQEQLDKIRPDFQAETDAYRAKTVHAGVQLQNVFDFLERALPQSQELVVFVTNLNTNFYSTWFIRENGCESYYKYNKELLFHQQHEAIRSQMEELEEMLK